jgi:hypothetical protein
MFCLARTIASLLSQAETCPTDTAMNRLVSDWLETLGRKQKDSSLTRAEFVEILADMISKIPGKTKSLDAIHTTYFRTSPAVVEPEQDDVSVFSISSISPPVAPQPSVEPSPSSAITPDARVDDESNSVLSLFDDGNGSREKEEVRTVNSTRSNESSKVSQQIVPNPPSRPSSASSLREKPLAVLPPINPSASLSPRGPPSRSLSSRKPSIESQQTSLSTAQSRVATSFVNSLLNEASVVAYCQETAEVRKQLVAESEPGPPSDPIYSLTRSSRK